MSDSASAVARIQFASPAEFVGACVVGVLGVEGGVAVGVPWGNGEGNVMPDGSAIGKGNVKGFVGGAVVVGVEVLVVAEVPPAPTAAGALDVATVVAGRARFTGVGDASRRGWAGGMTLRGLGSPVTTDSWGWSSVLLVSDGRGGVTSSLR